MNRSLVLGSSPPLAAATSISPRRETMRIAIIEPLLMLRSAITKACQVESDCEVIAEAGSGSQALRAVVDHQPELVVLNLLLPDMDGFRVVERIRARAAATRILILSPYSDDFTILRVEQANVQGFVDQQHNTLAVLRDALRAIAAGGTYFSPAYEVARQARHADPRSFDKLLSAGEQRVLRLIAEGLTDEEIGELLRISPRTVRTHRHNILQKLGVAGTPKLIAFAMRHGFTTRNPPIGFGRARVARARFDYPL